MENRPKLLVNVRKIDNLDRKVNSPAVFMYQSSNNQENIPPNDSKVMKGTLETQKNNQFHLGKIT
jgi:hypothetical protein